MNHLCDVIRAATSRRRRVTSYPRSPGSYAGGRSSMNVEDQDCTTPKRPSITLPAVCQSSRPRCCQALSAEQSFLKRSRAVSTWPLHSASSNYLRGMSLHRLVMISNVTASRHPTTPTCLYIRCPPRNDHPSLR